MKKRLKHSGLLLLSCCGFYLMLLMFPNPLFAHQYHYQNFEVYSDHEIPAEINIVLDDVRKRITTSNLYHSKQTYRIYICQKNWRFSFFTRNPNAGGLVNFLISPNIFIRSSDIPNNRLIPPGGWMYEAKDRPLSYFIAHETTHAMQRDFDPLMIVNTKGFIIEGYADYIGKAGHFDYEKYKAAYLEHGFELETQRGLYNKYLLYMAYLMDVKGMSFAEVLETECGLDILEELRK